MRRRLYVLALVTVGCLTGAGVAGAQETALPLDLTSILEPIRDKHGLPALGGCVLLDGKVVGLAVTGFRRAGDPTPATAADRFHLGSCTKAMTATLIARLVEAGKLHWEDTLADLFPRLRTSMHPLFRPVTLEQLLHHRGGLPERSWPADMSLAELHRLAGTLPEQRLFFIRKMLAEKPETKPGAAYVYSNAGYVVAGAAAEAVTGRSWEELITDYVFHPLGMSHAGFGAMGTPGRVDEPWQHEWRDGRAVPVAPGPHSDNPLLLGPAGTVHCPLGDWARFVQAHLDGARGESTFLSAASFQKLHVPPAGNGYYVMGWMEVERDWGRGKVYTHAGSNVRNWAVVWMAPARNLAVMVTANVGGNDVYAVIDRAVGELISAAVGLK